MELLSKEIDVPIVILGPDLQLEGIAKNKSFAFDGRERPAGGISATCSSWSAPREADLRHQAARGRGRGDLHHYRQWPPRSGGMPCPPEFSAKTR